MERVLHCPHQNKFPGIVKLQGENIAKALMNFSEQHSNDNIESAVRYKRSICIPLLLISSSIGFSFLGGLKFGNGWDLEVN